MTGKRFTEDTDTAAAGLTPQDTVRLGRIIVAGLTPQDTMRLGRIIETLQARATSRSELSRSTVKYLRHLERDRSDKQAEQILADLAHIGIEVFLDLILSEPQSQSEALTHVSEDAL